MCFMNNIVKNTAENHLQTLPNLKYFLSYVFQIKDIHLVVTTFKKGS